MLRLVSLAALVAGACGTATDDRPATLEYITDTILAPSCAAAQCHSAFKRQVGDAFDTVASTRHSIVANLLVSYPGDVADPASSYLIQTITVGSQSILDPSLGNVRMPYDSAMPDADVKLLERWIADGLPGAQCEPSASQRTCVVQSVAGKRVYGIYACNSDGNVGDLVMTCPQNPTTPTEQLTCLSGATDGACR